MWIESENKIRINFIRHGKTKLNEKHCYVGITDDDLSENGACEIRKKCDLKIYPETEIVFVSPMKRAKETATIIYPDINPIEIDEFREMDFGSFEGKCYEELKNNNHYRRWIDKSRGISEEELREIYGELSNCEEEITLPEDKKAFSDRIIKGFIKVLKLSKNKNEISIVAHGGTVMAIVDEYTSDDYYKFMLACGEGISCDVIYKEEKNGNIKVSFFSINNRICS